MLDREIGTHASSASSQAQRGQDQLASAGSTAQIVQVQAGWLGESELATGTCVKARWEGVAQGCASAPLSTHLSATFQSNQLRERQQLQAQLHEQLRTQLHTQLRKQLPQQLVWLQGNDSTPLTLVQNDVATALSAGAAEVSEQRVEPAAVASGVQGGLDELRKPFISDYSAVSSPAESQASPSDACLELEFGVGGLVAVRDSASSGASSNSAVDSPSCVPCEPSFNAQTPLRMLILFAGRRRPKSLRRALERLGKKGLTVCQPPPPTNLSGRLPGPTIVSEAAS
jgi:hypothetical protein